ncbi:uncharacterized protein LOC104584097 [Brachypodium distachyon]|uniref:uncharacterized protein LOC104584097 n=1 Tax=Brachypodium distachyon TaxID=15368 RepID=UPI00052FF245|nr:uncharacterized protein LOC104584097 [Brachypodium distachyon]|eukprot:XP_010236529.1 uncharacterized protein LOC104584097 [Brachypodium distachyon]
MGRTSFILNFLHLTTIQPSSSVVLAAYNFHPACNSSIFKHFMKRDRLEQSGFIVAVDLRVKICCLLWAGLFSSAPTACLVAEVFFSRVLERVRRRGDFETGDPLVGGEGRAGRATSVSLDLTRRRQRGTEEARVVSQFMDGGVLLLLFFVASSDAGSAGEGFSSESIFDFSNYVPALDMVLQMLAALHLLIQLQDLLMKHAYQILMLQNPSLRMIRS